MERLFEVRKAHFHNQRDSVVIDFGDLQNHLGPGIPLLPPERNASLLEYLYCLRDIRREVNSLLQAEFDDRDRGLRLIQQMEEEQSVWQGRIVQSWETRQATPTLEAMSAPVVKKSESMRR